MPKRLRQPVLYQYMRGALRELVTLEGGLIAWRFLCAASFLDYLSCMTSGKGGANAYKSFITTWFPAKYGAFTYRNGKKDLPIQMYHVLRCGLVHSFSLVPDSRGVVAGGRKRSIVFATRGDRLGVHLAGYSKGSVVDAALFVLEDFLEDVWAVNNKLFKQAETDRALAARIMKWSRNHPPILHLSLAGKY